MAYDASAPKAAEPKIPDGYDSIGEFLEEARTRFLEDQSFDRENRDEAYTDLQFFAGEQWAPEDIAQRKGRPCLMINQLPQFVAQVTGDIRINRPSIKVRPAEDADKDLAEIREGLIRAIQRDSKADHVYSATGQMQTACGIGNFRVSLDYAADDVFDRDITIKPIPNPFAVVWDAARIEPTGADAGHAFVAEDMPRKQFEARWPDKSPSDMGSELQQNLMSNGWLTQDIVRVTEYWVMKDKPCEIAMLQDGSIKELTAKNRDRLMANVAQNASGKPMIRKTFKKVACMYLITGHDILEPPVEYPLSRIPIFRVPGWEVNTGTKTIRWGLVRFAKDAQRLKNYWRSVAAEKLALAPRQQWLIHESQSGDQEDFRTAASSGETVLTWNGSVKPERLEPPPVEAALLQEAQMNAQDMKDVTGLHDASLGIKSNETSGKAIMARQREGDVATYIYQDNLNAAIEEAGRVINDLIPIAYDTARTIRVLGEDETQKIMRVNDPNDPDSIDLAKGRYDIVVETGPSYSTKRVEAAESMMAFVQAVPQAAAVTADLIAQAQDWPLADKIAERLKKALPPNIVEDDEEQQTPEAMQAKQAAAQQAQKMQEMQEHSIELDLNEKAAKVEKLHAEANKINAEANAPATGPEPQDAGMQALLLRKATAEAATAEANAGIAYFNLAQLTGNPRLAEAEASKAEAEAIGAHIDNVHSLADLEQKPLEAAHSKADLKIKLNPPKEPAKPKA